MNFESPIFRGFQKATRGRVAKPLDCHIYEARPVRKAPPFCNQLSAPSISAILVNRRTNHGARKNQLLLQRSKFQPFHANSSK